jgi:hypothetical protein
LEAEVGAEFNARSTRGIELTADGRVIWCHFILAGDADAGHGDLPRGLGREIDGADVVSRRDSGT